jgi:hypothetical protein
MRLESGLFLEFAYGGIWKGFAFRRFAFRDRPVAVIFAREQRPSWMC